MEKQPAVRVSRLPTFAFLCCAEMHSALLTGLSAAGLLGVAVDKVSRCVAIPALPAVREWHGQAGVSCAAKSPVSFLLHKKGLLYWAKPMYSSPFLRKRELTELFAAHDTPVCPRHSQTAGINGIATHQETLSTATPKRPAAESPVSKVLYSLHSTKKAKADSLLTRTAGCYPSSNKVFIREMLPPPPPQHDHVRTEGFLY